MQHRQGFRVYPNNVTRAVEISKIKRGDKIDFMEFAEMVTSTCQFIVFPAFRLQSIMKERFGGLRMWSYINKRMTMRQKDMGLLRERDKFLKRSEELRI